MTLHRVFWMPLDHPWQPATPGTQHCCEDMASSLEHACEQHPDPFDCADTPLIYHEVFGEYGIPVRDGGASYLLLAHCPWCGVALPASGRDRWFDRLEAAGLADAPFANLPPELRSAAWRIPNQS